MKLFTAVLYDRQGHRTGQQRKVQAPDVPLATHSILSQTGGFIEFQGHPVTSARIYTHHGHWEIRGSTAKEITPHTP